MNIWKKIIGPRVAKTTAGALAEKFGLEIRGNSHESITGVSPIADAVSGDLAFYSTERNSENFKILPIEVLKNTRASVILLQPEQIENAPKGATLLITNSPRGEIVKILGEIFAEKPPRGVDTSAIIARGVFFRDRRSCYVGPNVIIEKGAVIESKVKIYANAFIGKNVSLGENTVVHSGAHIENATVGPNSVIYSNAVIGKDGFGFTRQDGKNVFIPHVGRVVLGERVSVGANSCIDRGLMTDTVIGNGTKIDNLCQIAHGVVVGQECFLAAGVGIAGGSVIGDRALLGGHVGIANKVKIGADVEIGANSGVFRDIPAGEKQMGYPATPGMEFMRTHAWLRKQMNKKGTGE